MGSLEPTIYVDIEEMVVLFLHIIAQDVKNKVVRQHFARPDETRTR